MDDRQIGRPAWRPPVACATALSIHAAAAGLLAAVPSTWPLSLGAVAGTHAVLGVAALFPGNTLLGPTVTRLPHRAAGVVGLTFDDGPDPEMTPRVLDVLDRHGARASFFMIGARAAAHPALVRDVVRRGHEVENHTMHHKHHFALLGLAGQRREWTDAQAILTELAGRAPRMARAPAGIRSPLTDPVLHGLGLRHASWTRRGFDTGRASADSITRRLTQGLQAADILLLHDGDGRRGPSVRAGMLEALAALLQGLDTLGLRSVSVARALDDA